MGHLTEDQKQFYKKNGYIKLGGLFTDEEMDVISKEYNEIFFNKISDDMEGSWTAAMKETKDTDLTVKSVHNLQYHSAVFSEVLRKPELLDALEDVMETKNILLHHTKAHFKPPGNGAPYPTHQDYHYFPFKNDSMVAVFIHVDPATRENGGLCVYPGSHKLGPQEDKGGAVIDGRAYHYLDQDKFPTEKALPITAARGEVIIFSYLLIHGSYVNKSDKPRRMFLIQLMSAEDEPLEGTAKSYGHGWVLRGKNKKMKALFSERHEKKPDIVMKQ